MTEEIKQANLICPECTGAKLQKAGFSNIWKARQRVRVQRYRCSDCGLLTTRPDGFSQEHTLKCLRCGHEWGSDNPHPVRCAKCKSPYWDKEK
jgi:rubredoxin